MNLEELVPPLELCKLIPAGEFAYSVFYWFADLMQINTPPPHEYKYTVHEADYKGYNWGGFRCCPAPTLQEIMSELSLCDEYGDTGWFCMVGDPEHWSIGNCECDLYVKNGTESNSPEESALKVWLKLKGIEA